MKKSDVEQEGLKARQEFIAGTSEVEETAIDEMRSAFPCPSRKSYIEEARNKLITLVEEDLALPTVTQQVNIKGENGVDVTVKALAFEHPDFKALNRVPFYRYFGDFEWGIRRALAAAGLLPPRTKQCDRRRLRMDAQYCNEILSERYEYQLKVDEMVDEQLKKSEPIATSTAGAFTCASLDWNTHQAWKKHKLITPIRYKAIHKIIKRVSWGGALYRTLFAINYLLCVDKNAYEDFRKLVDSKMFTDVLQGSILYKPRTRRKGEKLPNKDFSFNTSMLRAKGCYKINNGARYREVQSFDDELPEEGLAGRMPMKLDGETGLNKFAYNLIKSLLRPSLRYQYEGLHTIKSIVGQKYIHQDQESVGILKTRLNKIFTDDIRYKMNSICDKTDILYQLLHGEDSQDLTPTEIRGIIKDVCEFSLNGSRQYYLNGRIAIINDAIYHGTAPQDMLIVTETDVRENEKYPVVERNKVIADFFRGYILNSADFDEYTNSGDGNGFDYQLDIILATVAEIASKLKTEAICYDKVVYSFMGQKTQSIDHMQLDVFRFNSLANLVDVIEYVKK